MKSKDPEATLTVVEAAEAVEAEVGTLETILSSSLEDLETTCIRLTMLLTDTPLLVAVEASTESVMMKTLSIDHKEAAEAVSEVVLLEKTSEAIEKATELLEVNTEAAEVAAAVQETIALKSIYRMPLEEVAARVTSSLDLIQALISKIDPKGAEALSEVVTIDSKIIN